MQQQIRQGDVLLVPCKSIPKAAKPVLRDKGRVVLAYGEVTGHAHAITSPHAALFSMQSFGRKMNYLSVEETVKLGHEEHDEHEVTPGNYRVVQQREFDPQAPQPVRD